MINSSSGPSKRKPSKLPLFPKEGDFGEAMDVDSHKVSQTVHGLPASPDAAILHGLPVVKDINDKIKLNHALESPQEEEKTVVSKMKNQETEISLADIKCFEKIGEGSSGVVQKAIHVPTKTKLALKRIAITKDQKQNEKILGELEIMKKCQHPNVVTCYSAFIHGGEVCIALEYMSQGSLAMLLRILKRIPEGILGAIAFQIVNGLVYLHKGKKIIHRDIKPSNILLGKRGRVKIGDFGVCSQQLANSLESKASWVGTLLYMSPERLLGKEYSVNSDVWSLGVTLIECALGHYPYLSQEKAVAGEITYWEIFDKITKRPSPKLEGTDYSESFKDFISQCLVKDKELRPSSDKLLGHPFLAKYAEVDVTKNLKEWLKLAATYQKKVHQQ